MPRAQRVLHIKKKGAEPTKFYADDRLAERSFHNTYESVLLNDKGEPLDADLVNTSIAFHLDGHGAFIQILFLEPERQDDTVVKTGIVRLKCDSAKLRFSKVSNDKWTEANANDEFDIADDDIIYDFTAFRIVMECTATENILIPRESAPFKVVKDHLLAHKKLRLIVRGSTKTAEDYEQLQSRYTIEAISNPLLKWFKTKRPFFQEGQLLKMDARPKYRYKARYSFFDWLDYQVTQGMGMIQEAEFNKAKYDILNSARLKIRIVALPACGDRSYMAFIPIPLGDQSRLQPDDVLQITFDADDNRSKAWSGRVILPVPYTPVNMVSAIIYRPWDTEKSCPKDNRRLPLVALDTDVGAANSMRGIVRGNGILARISVNHSDGVYKRELAAVEMLSRIYGVKDQQLSAKERHDLQIMLAKNFLKLPSEDPYSTICPSVDNPESLVSIGDGQKEAVAGLRESPAGWHLVHGPPGTGKTHYAAEICKPFLVDEEEHQVLAMSTANNGVDSLAERYDATLRGLQAEAKAKGNRYVLRLHGLKSESNIYLRDATAARKMPNARPKVCQQLTDEEKEALDHMETAKSLHDHYRQATELGPPDLRDRRVKLLKLSVGYRMLEIADIVPGGVLKEVEEFGAFKESYRQYQNNHELKPENWTEFRRQAKDLMAYTIHNAAVVCTTPALAAGPFVRECMREVKIMVGDEFGRMTDSGVWPLFLYPALQLKVMIFDPYQLRPVVMSGDANNFAEQLGISFPARLMGAGFPTQTLNMQYRAVPQIAEIYNKVTYSGRLQNHSSTAVSQRPLAQDIMRINHKIFKKSTSVIYLDIKSAMTSKTDTGSSYNDSYVAYALNLVERLVLEKFEGSIGLITPYQAEFLCLSSGLTILKAKYPDIDLNVHLDKIDRLQGEEFDVTIVSLTVTGEPGFLADLNRLTVLFSRAKHGLYVLGNKKGIDEMKRNGRNLQNYQEQLLEYRIVVAGDRIESEFHKPE